MPAGPVGGMSAAPAGRLGATSAALRQGAAARDGVGAPTPGMRKRKFPDQPATSLEEGGAVCKQGMLRPALKRLRRERWGPVAAAALPHAEPGKMEPGSRDAQSTEAGASRNDATHADEELLGAPLLQADPGFAMLDGAVQAVLLALVHARLLRDGGLDEACLAELAALPPEEQHEVATSCAPLHEPMHPSIRPESQIKCSIRHA